MPNCFATAEKVYCDCRKLARTRTVATRNLMFCCADIRSIPRPGRFVPRSVPSTRLGLHIAFTREAAHPKKPNSKEAHPTHPFQGMPGDATRNQGGNKH